VRANVKVRSASKLVQLLFVTGLTIGFNTDAFAWGQEGHSAVGVKAVEQLQADVRLKLERLLGSIDEQEIVKACNWPDAVRETKEWAWSEPLHYINIPEDEARYSRSRDCPDQQCITEAIKQYANILGDQTENTEQGWQAFAWLCHLTGDLHQPLHAGLARDRGGNNFKVIFHSEPTDLHEIWDHDLIESYVEDWNGLFEWLDKFPVVHAGNNWSADMVNDWTEESHQLAVEVVYPKSPEISLEYEQRSWALIQLRLATASSRLAYIINTVLAEE